MARQARGAVSLSTVPVHKIIKVAVLGNNGKKTSDQLRIYGPGLF